MNSAATVDNWIAQWKQQGLSRAELAVKIAEACMGWPYVWGSLGEIDTPEKRSYYMNRSAIGPKDAELIRKRCQVLNGSHALCSGCKYYPGGAKTRMFDCRGFTRWILQQCGITIQGAGATSQYNTAANWSERGLIKDLPPGAVACVFKQVNGKTMEHTGLHIGGGQIIHCSVEVKRSTTDDRSWGWTHYAIPRGLEGGDVPVWRSTIRKGSRGDDVTYLQERLNDLRYSVGTVDGIFGEKTRKAVMEFQRANGLGVDGVVGPMTWEAISNADGEGEAPTVLYTVTIKGLTKDKANEITSQYGGEIAEE